MQNVLLPRDFALYTIYKYTLRAQTCSIKTIQLYSIRGVHGVCRLVASLFTVHKFYRSTFGSLFIFILYGQWWAMGTRGETRNNIYDQYHLYIYAYKRKLHKRCAVWLTTVFCFARLIIRRWCWYVRVILSTNIIITIIIIIRYFVLRVCRGARVGRASLAVRPQVSRVFNSIRIYVETLTANWRENTQIVKN